MASNSNQDAIEAARLRRAANASTKALREQWFIDQVANVVTRSLEQRVLLATELLKNKIIVNISRPVTKTRIKGARGRDPTTGQFTAGRSYTVVTNRSKPGEFPKADTTQLMKTIFSDYAQPKLGVYEGYVGTPIDYGLFLELFMDRAFLVRTLNEQRPSLARILGGPIT